MEKRPSKIQNYSANQFEVAFAPHRLQNWRIPYEKEGIVWINNFLLFLFFLRLFKEPGKNFKKVRPCTADGKPDFICDDNGHLFKEYKTRSFERTAFRKAPETGSVGFAFTSVGYT